MGWPRRPRTSEPGELVGKRVGQQGSPLLASHQACQQEDGWFLPHGRGQEWRDGGLVARATPWANQVST